MVASEQDRAGPRTRGRGTLGLAFLAGYLVGLGGGARPRARKPPAGAAPEKLNAEMAAVLHEETDRGRNAGSPAEIPAKGWKDILLRVYREFDDDHVMTVAAGVSFYALLSLFPAIAALVSIYGLYADPGTIQSQLDKARWFLPYGAADLIGDYLKRVTARSNQTLGWTFVIGLAISLWTANAGVKGLFDALNVVNDEREKRSFLRLNAISLLFTLGTLALLLLSMGALVVLPIVLRFLGLAERSETIISLARWPILMLVIAGALALLFRFGPSRRKAQWQWISVGSVVATLGCVAVSAVFSWYVSLANYSEAYGPIGAVLGFMTWLWLSVMVVLIGAEINAEMEHQTARDSTTGPEKPLGTRGATMADTIGKRMD